MNNARICYTAEQIIVRVEIAGPESSDFLTVAPQVWVAAGIEEGRFDPYMAYAFPVRKHYVVYCLKYDPKCAKPQVKPHDDQVTKRYIWPF